MRGSQHLSAKQIAKRISAAQLSEAKKLRNWAEAESPSKYQKGVKAFTTLIEIEENNK